MQQQGAVRAQPQMDRPINWKSCEHQYITTFGKGWVCSRCNVGILSLSVPLPIPLVQQAYDIFLPSQKVEVPHGIKSA